jgi:membrane fusion protein, multidrug efflux system
MVRWKIHWAPQVGGIPVVGSWGRASLAGFAMLVIGTACSKPQPKSVSRPPVPVTVTTVNRAAVPYTISSNGLVAPVQLANVTPQVDGLITQVTFREGDEVPAGRVLFQIEPAPYRAAYQQALATLARDRANAENARREVERYEGLATKEYVTKEQADQVRATADAAEATVRADAAAVATAKFNLGNTKIRAPIEGRTGSLLVRTGNVVHASQATPLVVINQVRPILVRFTVPGTELPLIQRYASRGGLPVTAVLAASTPASGSDTSTAGDPAGTPPDSADAAVAQQLPTSPPPTGTLFFIDNTVDTTTGTIMLKASFPNRSGELWAGEFVLTSLRLFVEQHALVVPSQAVRTGQRGTYAYVVDSTGKAQQRPVAVERSTATRAVIASGLREGERVVTDGQSRLTPGAKVTIVSTAAAAASTPPPTPRRRSP